MSTKLWNRNFTMVIIGQIISLFGNAILRFALPLYLLNETGSAALFGIVSAFAFIPMILLAPIGGIFADRVNKRNIMVILDFSTALLISIFTIALGKFNLVGLILITLIILYGIQGAYQPSVQASIPVLQMPENIMQSNAAINLVSSSSALAGPVTGGVLFGFFGIKPILFISIGCFLASAVMEIFIKIPFEKRETEGSIIQIGMNDLKESFHYMTKEQPLIIKVSGIIAIINLVLSALIIIGLPVIITQTLSLEAETANRLYGYAEGIFAAGSLTGGIMAGALSRKFRAKNSYRTLFVCALTLIPMGIAVALPFQSMVSYGIIVVSGFFMMLLAALFSVQMMAYLQMIVPTGMLGKIISCAMCIGMCATPLGQAIYGGLFQVMSGQIYLIFAGAALITCISAVWSKDTFKKMAELLP